MKKLVNIAYYFRTFILIIHFYFVFMMLNNILDTKLFGYLFLLIYAIYIIKCIIELLSGKKRYKTDIIYNLMQIGILSYIIFLSIKVRVNEMYVTEITYPYFRSNCQILSVLIIFILIYGFIELKNKNKKIWK